MATAASPIPSNRACVESAEWSEPVAYDLTRTGKRASVPKERKSAVPRGAGVYAICAEGTGQSVSDLILDIGECGPRPSPSSGRGLQERLASAVAHSASERIARDVKNGKLQDALFVVWSQATSKEEAKKAQDALICLFKREFGKQPKYNTKLEDSSCLDKYVILYERLKALVNEQPCEPETRESSTTQAQQRQQIDHVARKLQTLSAERLGEVEDFIDFLNHRDSERELTRMAMAASEPVLRAVWDNLDDAEYDAL